MKKNTRSFTVEYRTGRRRPERKPHSIWGDIDLKSVARQSNDEAFALPVTSEEASNLNSSSGQDRFSEPVLTQPILQPNNASLTQESPMPDEIEAVTDTDIQTDTDAPNPVVAPAPPVKQRKLRAKKTVSAETDSGNAKVGKRKPGPKPRTVSAPELAEAKTQTRPQRASDANLATPVDAIDDLAELLRLEEENRSLRKQLSEKLRSENADLKKRLNLS